MSTYSLPHLVNGGGGLSGNRVVNQKYASLNRYSAGSTPRLATVGRSRDAASMLRSRRQTLNRDGSISRNQFRGIKKQMLDSQTDMILHSMTVRGG